MADGNAASQTILVVGGGMGGMTAAVEAAEVGYDVILVEKNPYLGGRVAQLNKYFPKLCTPACGLEINFQRIRNNPRISHFTMAEVEDIQGGPGNYKVRIRQNPRFVNEKCTGCGDCSLACTSEIDDPFNFDLGKVKAIRKAHTIAFPHHFVMDPDYAKSAEAKKLANEVCPVKAIEPDMTAKVVEIPVASIVWSTGWTPFDAAKIQPYGFDRFENVTTNMRFERLNSKFGPTGGKIVRKDGKEVKNIAFIQCAGSRDHNYLPYCSRICCLASMKQATYIREAYPDSKVTIYYIDLRAMDRYEAFQKKVEADKNITWIKSKPARIDEDPATKNPIVIGENTLTGIRYADSYDMVVLATGMEPNTVAAKVPVQGAAYDDYSFVVGGPVHACGCSTGPLDVAAAVQSGTAAALKAVQTVVKARG